MLRPPRNRRPKEGEGVGSQLGHRICRRPQSGAAAGARRGRRCVKLYTDPLDCRLDRQSILSGSSLTSIDSLIATFAPDSVFANLSYISPGDKKPSFVTGKRYYVKINFHKHKSGHVFALYDTGASVTTVSLATMRTARAAGALGEQINDHGLTLKNASNEEMNIHGVYWITMVINDHSIVEPVVVLKQLSGDMIIGQNVIHKHGLQYNPVRESFEFKQPSTPAPADWAPARLAAVSSFVIPARSARLTRARIIPDMSTVPPGTPPPIIPPKQHFVGSVCGSPVSHVTDANGVCRIYLTNPLNEPITVERNTIIGTADPASLYDFDSSQLDTDALHSICAAADARRQRETSSPPETTSVSTTKLKMIDAAIQRSNMPKKWNSIFRALLIRHHSVISETPDDLGHCKTVVHDITMRTEEPCYSKQFSLPPHELECIKQHVKSWLAAGLKMI